MRTGPAELLIDVRGMDKLFRGFGELLRNNTVPSSRLRNVCREERRTEC